MKIFSFPTMLTLGRLIISPLVLPVLIVYLLPQNIFFVNAVLAILFVLLSLTDLFDGFLARRFNQVTKLGKQLDPIADKFLTYSTLIALLAAGKIFFYWPIIFIGRDFFVMGLRAIAKEKNISIPISFWSKVKTFSLMAYLAFVILNPYQLLGFEHSWNLIELLLLCIALLMTFWSGKTYYDAFKKQYGPLDTLFGTNEKIEPIEHDWFKDKTSER